MVRGGVRILSYTNENEKSMTTDPNSVAYSSRLLYVFVCMFSMRYLPCDDAVQCRTSSVYSVLFVSESLGVCMCACATDFFFVVSWFNILLG